MVELKSRNDQVPFTEIYPPPPWGLFKTEASRWLWLMFKIRYLRTSHNNSHFRWVSDYF